MRVRNMDVLVYDDQMDGIWIHNKHIVSWFVVGKCTVSQVRVAFVLGLKNLYHRYCSGACVRYHILVP